MLDKGSDILEKMPTLFVRKFDGYQVKKILNGVIYNFIGKILKGDL